MTEPRLDDLKRILEDFPRLLSDGTVRERVRSLTHARDALIKLGLATLPPEYGTSAKSRILAYFRAHVGEVIDGVELMVVGAISEYARRIRELRVQDGWPIISGLSPHDAAREAADTIADGLPTLRPEQYCLVEDHQDSTAAARWRRANEIRRGPGGAQEKLLSYFRENVGVPLTKDELRYVAGGRAEWARRIRELRTEGGWPIVTRMSGDPRLPQGTYVLKVDRQDEPHDRHISDLTRREVLKRDHERCRWHGCGWPVGFPASDSRFLELHHVVAHVSGGSNEEDNLVTLCNLHHDEVHRSGTLLLDPV